MLTGCLWLIEEKILCIFLENGRGGCVDISTIFKNPDIYIYKYVEYRIKRRKINIIKTKTFLKGLT